MNRALLSSKAGDYLTPREVIDRVIAVLGVVDLDPCSNRGTANVPATTHYTVDDDGLAREWHGATYMNCPYGRGIGAWVQKLCDEYAAGRVTRAIALLPARPDTAWFRLLAGVPVCFLSGRLRFRDERTTAPFPSMLAYFGDDLAGFTHVFGGHGRICPPVPGGFGPPLRSSN